MSDLVPLHPSGNIWQILAEDIRKLPADDISIKDMLTVMRDRAYGLALILFALPNCVPLPPIIASVFGVPLLFFAAQMCLGQQQPNLPALLTRQRFKKHLLLKGLAELQKFMRGSEKLCRSRFHLLSSATSQHFLGFFLIPVALTVMVPLPFTNFLPALVTLIIGFGLLNRDGIIILLGLASGLIVLFIIFGILSSLNYLAGLL